MATFNTIKNLRDEHGVLHYNPETHMIILDKAGVFNYSIDCGLYSLRAFVVARGHTAHLDHAGKLYTDKPYDILESLVWVTMVDGGPRSIFLGVQGKGEKAYALLKPFPFKDPGLKKYHGDEHIFRVKLSDPGGCKILSFDEPIANRTGILAKKNFDDAIKSSSIFYGKWLSSSDAIMKYCKSKGPSMEIKVGIAYDHYVMRKRKEYAREFAHDKEGELKAVNEFMALVEPERMWLEERAADYDLPLSERIFYVDIGNDANLYDHDIASATLEKFAEQLK